MTTTEQHSSMVEWTKEQTHVENPVTQEMPQKTSVNTDDHAALSDSSNASEGNVIPPLVKVASILVPSDRTPICRFFKHGELIRKPTLTKARKRKGAPVRKKEIFGSPFSADYFAKPLATGLNRKLPLASIREEAQ